VTTQGSKKNGKVATDIVSINRGNVRDIYIATELQNAKTVDDVPIPYQQIAKVFASENTNNVTNVIMELPEEKKEHIMQCISQREGNEVVQCLYAIGNAYKNSVCCDCCVRWERESVGVERITTGGIIGLGEIHYNGRHRIADLTQTDFAYFDVDVIPQHMMTFIAVEDDRLIEDDDTSNYVRLIDGAHRVAALARAGHTKFDIYVGYT